MPLERYEDQTVPTLDLPIGNVLPVPEKYWHSTVHSCRSRQTHLQWARKAIQPPDPKVREANEYDVPALRSAPRSPKEPIERFKRQFRKYWIWKAYPWTRYKVDEAERERPQEDDAHPPTDGPDGAPPRPQKIPNFSKKLDKQPRQVKPSRKPEAGPRRLSQPLVINRFAICQAGLATFDELYNVTESDEEDGVALYKLFQIDTLDKYSTIPEVRVEEWHDVSNPKPSLYNIPGPARRHRQPEIVNPAHLHIPKPGARKKRPIISEHVAHSQKDLELVGSVTSSIVELRGGSGFDGEERRYEVGSTIRRRDYARREFLSRSKFRYTPLSDVEESSESPPPYTAPEYCTSGNAAPAPACAPPYAPAGIMAAVVVEGKREKLKTKLKKAWQGFVQGLTYWEHLYQDR